MTALTFVAAGGASQSGVFAQPGIVAFLVVFGMAVLLYFVFRSMSKHLRKVNQQARDEEDAQLAMTAASEDGAARAQHNGVAGS